ncbi:MAG: serine hydrolase domain-containing protein [Pseudomonadota bacterium]
MSLSHWLTAALFFMGGSSAFAQDQALDVADEPLVFIVEPDRVQARIDQIAIETGMPSISIAAAHGDSAIWAYATGLADKEEGRNATPETAYRLASVSKPITAVAIMVLADRGVIDLDRPANDYLGDQKIVALAGSADDVTVRRLLSHRGGLPLHYNLIHESEDYERRALDETIALYGQAMLPPGLTHRYSNVGYAALERIIEVQSGMPFDRFLEETFFTPLDMTSAGVVTAPVHPEGAAIPYTHSGDRYAAYDMDTRGAGGVYMSASDLVRFGRFFSDALDGRSELLSRDASWEMLETQHEADEGRLEWYVLGWVHELRGEDRQYGTIYHLGSTPGVRAELWIYPDADLVIATLVNEQSYRPLSRAREAVIEGVLPQISYRPYASSTPYEDFDIPADLQAEWRGRASFGPDGAALVEFDFRDPLTPTVRVDGQGVHISRIARNADGMVTVTTSSAPVPTEDAARQPYELGFLLHHDDARLQGYVSTNRIATRNRDSGNFAYPVLLERLAEDAR